MVQRAGLAARRRVRLRVNSGANMPRLDYSAPSTIDEAVKMLAGASGLAKVLSGGTDLLVQLRSGRAKPDLIVDVKKIPDMAGIAERDGGVAIRAHASRREDRG